MSHQIPVLYTEQKTKKVKIWLDGYLVPRATLNSARLISAGKHEIDVVFYSSIDELKPGREFETDRYLITVEESHHDNQPLPRPSYAIQDPTMKNRPKSAAFVPPRLVPKPEPPPPPVLPSASSFSSSMNSYERQNPHPWGYAGTTAAMKRSSYDDRDEDEDNNHRYKQPSKVTKTSHFNPPAFQPHQPPPPPPPPVECPKPSFKTSQEQPGLLSDSFIQRLIGNNRPTIPAPVVTKPVSPARPSNVISWSNWNDPKSDDDDDDDEQDDQPSKVSVSNPKQTTANNNSKTMVNWHSLIQSTVPLKPIENQTKPTETMPKFDFDDNSFDNLFEDVDEL